MRSQSILNTITDSIRETALRMFSVRLKSVILYGSYTRGDNDDESDIDVFILVDMSTNELSEYSNELAKVASRLSLETERCTTVSIALQDLATYDKYCEYLPYFINISKEGVVIYAA